MTNRRLLLVLGTLCAASLGCASSVESRDARRIGAEVRKLFLAAEYVELLSLEGLDHPDAQDAAAANRANQFHGHPILGTLDITARPERAVIIQEIADSIARSGLGMAACFYPRHGMRAISRGKTTDLLICFECSMVYLFDSGHKKRARVDERAQALINSVLAAAGIKLDKSSVASP